MTLRTLCVGHELASFQMSGVYPIEQKCGKRLIAHLPNEGEWLWLYASATIPRFGPLMNIEPLMRVLRNIVAAKKLPVPIQPGHILGKVRVVNITRAFARQKYPHIPLFSDTSQILHIVERLALAKGFAVSGLPRFDRWPQLNQQQHTILLFAETQAALGMTVSSSDDEPPKPYLDLVSDDEPPIVPQFENNGDSDDDQLEEPPSSKTPLPPSFESQTSPSGQTKSPLPKHPRSQIYYTHYIYTLTHTDTH
jgi:hypothetical protein